MRIRGLRLTVFLLCMLGSSSLGPAAPLGRAETDTETGTVVNEEPASPGGHADNDAGPTVPDEATRPAVARPAVSSPFAGVRPNERRPLEITLDNLDIYLVLDQLLGQVLQLNYVVDPAIKGTISLRIQGQYTRDELLDLLNSVLQLHGLAITRGAKDLFKVVRKADSGKSASEVVTAGESRPCPGDVIQVVQLRYLAAAHVVTNVRNFVSPGAVVVAEPSVNAVLLADTAENVDKVTKIVALMDVDLFKDVYWRLFPLVQTDAADLGRDLEQIFKTQGLFARQGLDPGGLQVVPLKTINALLVVTRWENLLSVVGKWVTELDQEQTEKGAQVYVYFVQNGSAKDISELLKQLYGEKGTTKDKGQKTVIVERKKEAEKPAVETLGGEVSGEVQIIADEVNNAILIKARPRDYAILSDVLKMIDVMPRQVLIDVLIFDVELKEDLEYGVEWFLDSGKVNIGSEGFDTVTFLSDKGMGVEKGGKILTSDFAGFAYALFDKDQLRALFRLLASKTDTNIIASPNILALDNQESTIESGREVPVKTGETATSLAGAGTVSTFQYRNAGTILKVKPSINDRGLVRMEIAQESSDVLSEKIQGVDGVSFKTRKATTNLVAEDGQTIIIGGLIETTRTKTHSGIPLLKDLPVLGYIFGSRGTNDAKRELLMAITPHVIKGREQADTLTQEFTETVKGLKEALAGRKLSGAEAPLKPEPAETGGAEGVEP